MLNATCLRKKYVFDPIYSYRQEKRQENVFRQGYLSARVARTHKGIFIFKTLTYLIHCIDSVNVRRIVRAYKKIMGFR
jgi:hypothetical protein